MYLAMFDLSGIQNFIFQTNRLKEIAGGSYLVSKALFGNVPKLAGELESADWKTFEKGDLEAVRDADAPKNQNEIQEEAQDKSQGRAQVVYIGGGNALVLFDGKGTAEKFAAKLKRKVFEDTGGALRICWGGTEVKKDKKVEGEEYERLSAIMPKIYAALDTNKAGSPQTLPARGFSINALDNETFEPLLYFEDGIDGSRIMPRGRYLKLKEYEKYKTDSEAYVEWRSSECASRKGKKGKKGKRKNKRNAQTENMEMQQDVRDGAPKQFIASLLEVAESPKHGRFVFETDLDKFFGAGERKSFLAFVHIDGNTMGQYIRKFMEDDKRKGGLFEDLMGMRNLSAFIGKCYKDALRRTIAGEFGDPAVSDDAAQRVPLPFRPVVADGDDITFICRSDKAFSCLTTFVEELHKSERAKGVDIDPKKLSVGCGIALARDGYPFSTAVDIAEQLCKNAKASAIKRWNDGVIGFKDRKPDDGNGQPPISSVDFHVCQGELTTNVSDFRGRNHEQDAVIGERDCKICLCKRPYQIDIEVAAEGKPDYSFTTFLTQLGNLQEASAKGTARPARGKLKDMRDAYGEGYLAAKRCGETIIARDSALQGRDKDHTKHAQIERWFEIDRLYEPDDNDPDSKNYHATLFDAIDVMDLCTGAPAPAEGSKGGVA